MKKDQSKKSITLKKRWKKPVITTITKKELEAYIKAAANSGGCVQAWTR